MWCMSDDQRTSLDSVTLTPSYTCTYGDGLDLLNTDLSVFQYDARAGVVLGTATGTLTVNVGASSSSDVGIATYRLYQEDGYDVTNSTGRFSLDVYTGNSSNATKYVEKPVLSGFVANKPVYVEITDNDGVTIRRTVGLNVTSPVGLNLGDIVTDAYDSEQRYETTLDVLYNVSNFTSGNVDAAINEMLTEFDVAAAQIPVYVLIEENGSVRVAVNQGTGDVANFDFDVAEVLFNRLMDYDSFGIIYPGITFPGTMNGVIAVDVQMTGFGAGYIVGDPYSDDSQSLLLDANALFNIYVQNNRAMLTVATLSSEDAVITGLEEVADDSETTVEESDEVDVVVEDGISLYSAGFNNITEKLSLVVFNGGAREEVDIDWELNGKSGTITVALTGNDFTVIEVSDFEYTATTSTTKTLTVTIDGGVEETEDIDLGFTDLAVSASSVTSDGASIAAITVTNRSAYSTGAKVTVQDGDATGAQLIILEEEQVSALAAIGSGDTAHLMLNLEGLGGVSGVYYITVEAEDRAEWRDDNNVCTLFVNGLSVAPPTEDEQPEVAQTYIVSFDSNGGSSVSRQEVTEGNSATRPSTPTRSGYTFGGWYSDSSLISTYNFSSAVTGDVTVYAKWTQNVTTTPSTSTSTSGGSSNALSGPSYTNTVVILPANSGTLKLGSEAPKESAKVSLTPEPAKGYVFDSIKVTNKSGDTITLSESSFFDYSYFTQPNHNVTITVNFKADGSASNSTTTTTTTTTTPSTNVVETTSTNYTDVSADDWYYTYVQYAVESGFMAGTNNKFAPNTASDRGTVAQALAAMSENDTATAVTLSTSNVANFVDVSGSAYENAISWVVSKGVMTGYDEENFGTDNVLTREQFATTLRSYATYHSINTTANSTDLSDFQDTDTVSDWALDAVAWCVENDLMAGSDGNLNPQGEVTRAEVATMLYRFAEKFL